MNDKEFISREQLKSLIALYSRINLSYADPEALLVSILESAMLIISCKTAAFLIVDSRSSLLRFSAVRGKNKDDIMKIDVHRNSIANWVKENKEVVLLNNIHSDNRFDSSVQEKNALVENNLIAFPINLDGDCVGVVELWDKSDGSDFSDDDLDMVLLLGGQAKEVYRQAVMFRQRESNYSYLDTSVNAGKGYHTFIAKNPTVLSLIQNIRESGNINSSVLITGESGVGKELFAEQVHLLSSRANKPFIRVSCASLAPSLLESELFGHVKGAYTDASSTVKGRFEIADGGTLFLDEIGELPWNLQSKLLRVIQEKNFERVGSSETISVDVRIVAATNRDLEKMIQEKLFREDLYYRLNVLPISVPPLRERKEDLPDLCMHFLSKFKDETHKRFTGFSEAALNAIHSYMWPGNIRELENTIQRACILGKPPLIQVNDLKLPGNRASERGGSGEIASMASDIGSLGNKSLKYALDEFKKQYITKILIENNWNQTQAARVLDIQRTYVSKLISELGIKR